MRSEERIVRIEGGYGAVAEKIRAEAHGGRVLLLVEKGCGQALTAALALAGVGITRRDLSDGVLSDYGKLPTDDLPEGIMAVVGAGGAAAIESAKAVRLPRSVPRLLVPLDLSGLTALDPRAFFGTKGDRLRLSAEETQVFVLPDVLDASSRLREGLGVLLARMIECADGAYEELILEGKSPATSLEILRSAASDLESVRETDGARSLIDVAFSWREKGVYDLPASDGAHLFALLAAKQKGGRYTDYLFPATYAMIRLYARYLGDLPLEHAAPPDRVRTIELLSERCGLSMRALLRQGKTYAEGYDARVHATGEYREDFAEFFGKAVPLGALARVYRRTAKGEREGALVTPSDLLALLSLTGEAVSGYPLLRHVKLTGLLEPLLAAS